MFKKGGKFERFFPLYEAAETFILSTEQRTVRGPHIRDHLDSKRYISIVILALIPATFFGAYNVGYQAFVAKGIDAGWWQCFLSGFLTILPIILVSYMKARRRARKTLPRHAD